MEKTILDILQLIILVRVGYGLIKMMWNGRKNNKSIVRKVNKYISNAIHHKLDNALRKQRDAYAPKYEKGSNVIPLRKTK